MKLVLGLSVLVFAVLGVNATQWKDIISPADTPKYKEILSKLLLNPNFVDEQKITGKIAGGERAELGDFPYQVFMFFYLGNGASWLCGGSVNSKFIDGSSEVNFQ